jgi:hypothetical protein
MSRLRRFSYSISVAALLTALAHLFYPGVGEFLAAPGIILEGWVNLLILIMSKEEYPFQFYNWVGFSLLFYATSAYLALWLYTVSKGAKREVAIK